MNGRDTNYDPSCGTDLENRLSWAFVVVTITTERDKVYQWERSAHRGGSLTTCEDSRKLRVETIAAA